MRNHTVDGEEYAEPTEPARRRYSSEIDAENILQTRNRKRIQTRNIRTTLTDVTDYLADFDPETSARERRKLSRKIRKPEAQSNAQNNKTTALYDSKGVYRPTGEDLCDCLIPKCPGCHFPCANCNSTRCGATCRCYRKWMYEQIEFDAKDECIENTYLKITRTKATYR